MINRLPSWFKQDLPGPETGRLARLLSEFKINTVCRQAKCPNINRCFGRKAFTFLILGNTCTRSCGFCSVNKAQAGLRPDPEPPADEPERIASLVRILQLDYAVITSPARDDLSDGGAGQFARTIELMGGIKAEALIPDFGGRVSSLKCLLSAGPFVVAHNIETVKRLYPQLRPQADYGLSLGLLNKIKELKQGIITKSSLILGMGEARREVINAMEDLRDNKCDILTLGQYLAPSLKHYPVKEFISIEQFREYKRIGLRLGFKSVLSGPLARSSYQAEQTSKEISLCMT